MKKSIQILFAMCMWMLLIVNVSADEQYKLGIPINLQYTCTLNGAIPDASTTFNISIYYPNGTYLVNNKQTTAQGSGSFNYTTTFPSSGIYKVKMFCTNTTYSYSNEGNYIITPTGTTIDLTYISVYLFFLFICLVLTFFSFKLFNNNKFTNDKTNSKELYARKKENEFMFYIELLKKKLWIVGIFGIYLSILLFLALLDQLMINLGVSELNNILNITVIILSWGLIPFTLFWFIWLIFTIYHSTTEILKHEYGGFR
jgi:hypothetical protein